MVCSTGGGERTGESDGWGGEGRHCSGAGDTDAIKQLYGFEQKIYSTLGTLWNSRPKYSIFGHSVFSSVKTEVVVVHKFSV